MKAEDWLRNQLESQLAVRCSKCGTPTNKVLNPPIAKNVQRLRARGLADTEDIKASDAGQVYRVIATGPMQCPNCGGDISQVVPQRVMTLWHGFNPGDSPQPAVEEEDHEIVIAQWRGQHNELNTITKSVKQFAAEYGDIIEDDVGYPDTPTKKSAMMERSRQRRDGLIELGFFDRW